MKKGIGRGISLVLVFCMLLVLIPNVAVAMLPGIDIDNDVSITFAQGDSATNVTRDIILNPPEGIHNQWYIVWESSHPNIITSTGAVTRPENDTSVTLTLWIRQRFFTHTIWQELRTFTVVARRTPQLPPDNTVAITVTWNANGGSVNPGAESRTPGTAMGELPRPVRHGYVVNVRGITEEYPYVFIGWFDIRGNLITPNTMVPNYNVTYLARWNSPGWENGCPILGNATFQLPGRHLNWWSHPRDISFAFFGGSDDVREAMRRGMRYWNNSNTPIRFSENDFSPNFVRAIPVDATWWGLHQSTEWLPSYREGGSHITAFRIDMNIGRINRDALFNAAFNPLGHNTNARNMVTGIFSHELGHVVGLADGWLSHPPLGGNRATGSLMNRGTNFNIALGPTAFDVESVNILYPTMSSRGVLPLELAVPSVLDNQNEETKVISVSASYPHYDSVVQLASRATDIVRVEVLDGRVERLNSWLEPCPVGIDPYNIYTVYRLRVIEAFQGEAREGSIIEMRQLGGQQGNQWVINEGRVPITVGDDVVLFLYASSIENYPFLLLNSDQSAYYFTSSGTLESVHSGNDLTLTARNLEQISAGEAPTAPPTVPPTGPNVLPFRDVSPSNWFYPYVRHVFENSIMQGTTATTFAPNTNFSRAMVVATLYRTVHGGTAREIPYARNRSIFSDVSVNAWYSPYIAWAYDNEIATGVGSNRFAPSDPVTREQFATMMHRFAEFMEYDTAVRQSQQWNNFIDRNQISTWARDGLTWANYHGLITGRTSTTIVPGGTASRAEASAILMRFMRMFSS